MLRKFFGPTVRKNCSIDREKLLKFKAEGQEFANFFQIIRIIYSNSEWSEQVLVTKYHFFFQLFLSGYDRQIRPEIAENFANSWPSALNFKSFSR